MGRFRRHPWRAWLAPLSLLLLLPACWPAPVASAATSSGSSVGTAHPAYPQIPPGTYAPPVERPVIDPFRMEAGPYGPGNRGLEYATVRGDPVRAVAAGRVAFAGPVAGRLVVSIVHPDGRRSTLTHLASIDVLVGELVARGTPVGIADVGLHLGLLEGRRYVDPALFLTPRCRAVLVAPWFPPPSMQGARISRRPDPWAGRRDATSERRVSCRVP